MAVSGSNVYVVWCEYVSHGEQYIRFRQSESGSWGPSERIFGAPLAANQDSPNWLRPTIAVDINGKIHLAFNGAGAVSDPEDIYYAYKKPGEDWRCCENVTQSGDANDTTPAIATGGQYVHLIWAGPPSVFDLEGNDYEVLYKRADIEAEMDREDLTITKQAEPDSVQAGAQLTYTIHVTNTGDVDLHATVTDTLPNQVTTAQPLIWTPTITASGGVWTQTVIVTVKMGYSGTLTNVVQVTTAEGATGVYTETSEAQVTPMLEVTKRAAPDPVQAGAQLTYTIHVTNTGNVDLHATVTDTLPNQVTTAQPLIWTPTITAPDGVWMEQFTGTVEMGYAGPLTNVVEVATEGGATGIYTETSISSESVIYLPIILKSY